MKTSTKTICFIISFLFLGNLLSGEKKDIKEINKTFLSEKNFYKPIIYKIEGWTIEWDPEIAETKIRGLKQFYGVNSKKGLEFFEAHKAADVIHREECEKLLDGLTKKEQEKAEQASLYTARYLWNFLSGMVSKHRLQVAA